VGSEAEPIVVWLRGEHDIATDIALRRTLARAMAFNESAIVLDLTKVELMSASTLGVIVTARDFLRQRSRSLTVRHASPHVRRIIAICDLDSLFNPDLNLFSPDINPFGPDLAGAGAETAKALHTWVPVPEVEQAAPPPRTPVPAISAEQLAIA
jgi:anti-sigma B factor antagonist